MKEPQTVHSHRGPESAGARWILWSVAPQKEEGGLPLHPSSPGRGCDRASPGAGGEARGSPGSPCLRPKGLAPQALGSPPPGENSTGLGSGARAHRPSQIPGWLCKEQRATTAFSTLFLGPSPCLALPPSVPQCLCLGKVNGPKEPLGQRREHLAAMGSGVLPAATPVPPCRCPNTGTSQAGRSLHSKRPGKGTFKSPPC